MSADTLECKAHTAHSSAATLPAHASTATLPAHSCTATLPTPASSSFYECVCVYIFEKSATACSNAWHTSAFTGSRERGLLAYRWGPGLCVRVRVRMRVRVRVRVRTRTRTRTRMSERDKYTPKYTSFQDSLSYTHMCNVTDTHTQDTCTTHTHSYTHIHTHTHSYTHIHTHTHTYTLIHTHTHSYTLIHTHTHSTAGRRL